VARCLRPSETEEGPLEEEIEFLARVAKLDEEHVGSFVVSTIECG
jgi:hypothetical protein